MAMKELICIGCPMGCQLTVDMRSDQEMLVTGNTCPRGEAYAKKELTHPTRIVTSTVKVIGGNKPYVSVKTASDIPKDKIMACMKALQKISVKAPVHMGEVIIENVAETGSMVIATKSVQ